MPTVTLHPSAASYNGFDLAAGASRLAAVQTIDDNTSYITSSTQGARQTFAMDDLPSDAAVVTSHTTYNRLRNNAIGNPVARTFLRDGGGDHESADITYTGAWTTYQHTNIITYTTPAEVNGAELGVYFKTASSDACNCTYLAWDVTYGVASGGFVCLLLSLGPLIALTLTDLPGLAAAVSAKRGILIRPDEYVTAWREWRAYRHPRFWFRPASGLWLPRVA